MIRRFSETKRQLPSVVVGSILDGIRTESMMLSERKCQADRKIDKRK